MNFPCLLLLLIMLFSFSSVKKSGILNNDYTYVEFVGYNIKDTQRRHVCNCFIENIMLRNFRYLSAYQIPPTFLASTVESLLP